MRCPHCGNELIVVGRFGICPEHGQQSVQETNEQSEGLVYSAARSQDNVAFCRELARSADWPEDVLTRWPGPLAHEVYRLRVLLEEGQILGAVWQVKDVAEVCIKLPAVVMARDVLANSGDHDFKNRVRSGLFNAPLSMGTWLGLARDTLAKDILASRRASPLFCPELARLFRAAKGPTPAADFLGHIVTWRNEAFGHGALQLDLEAYRQDLREHVQGFVGLFQAWQEKQVWEHLEFRTVETPPVVLRGHATIHDWRGGQHPGPTQDLELEVWKGQASLNLAPLLTVKRCLVCRKRDVFFFDARKARRGGDVYHFLDYLAGHKLAQPEHLESGLSLQARMARSRPDQGIGGQVGTTSETRSSHDTLMEANLAQHHYPPSFIRDRLAAFVQAQDRGVFWLRAPAHCGKSTLVAGLDPLSRIKEARPLVPGLKTAVFAAKREFRFRTTLILHSLREAIIDKKCLDLPADAPAPMPESTPPDQVLADWLTALLARRPDDRLLICLDGLDELAQTSGPGILDYLPAPDCLPRNCYWLLTSRPLDECPTWIRQAMSRFEANQPGLHIWDFQRTEPEYVALLRKFFDQRMVPVVRKLLNRAIVNAARGETFLQDDFAPENPYQALARQELRAVLESMPAAPDLDPKGRSLDQLALNPLTRSLDAAFDAVLDKADHRFLYVSHLTGLLADGALHPAGIAELPPAERLFVRFLEELEALLPPKVWSLARRLLLALAAAEEAFAEDKQLRTIVLERPEWRGLPLDILADLLGEDAQGVEFLFTLYSLKDVLGAWRGDDEAAASFRLGLKDLAAVLRGQWEQDLRTLHGTVVRDFLDQWQDVLDKLPLDDSASRHRLASLPAHAVLCGDSRVQDAFWENEKLPGVYETLADQAATQACHAQAVTWLGLLLLFLSRKAGESPGWDARLLAAQTNMGEALYRLGRYHLAMERLEQGLVLAEQTQAPLETLVRLHLGLADAAEYAGDMDKAVESVHRAWSLVSALGASREFSVMLADVEWHRASLENAKDNNEAAMAILRSILNRLPELPDSLKRWEIACNTHNFLGNILGNFSNYEPNMEQYRHALNAAEQTGDPDLRATVMLNMATTHHDMHQYGAALPLTEQAYALGQRSGNPDTRQYAKGVQGMILTAASRYGEALEQLRQAAAIAEEHGIGWRLFNIYADMAQAHLGLGEIDQARQWALRGLADARRIGGLSFDLGYVEDILGDIAVAQGLDEEGENHYRQAMSHLQAADDHQKMSQTGCSLARLLIRQGRTDEAGALLEAALRVFQACGASEDEAEVVELLQMI